MICFPAAGALSSLPAVGVERRGFDFIPDSRCSVTRFKTRDAASLMGRMLNIPSFSLRLLFQRNEKGMTNVSKKVPTFGKKNRSSQIEYHRR